MGHDGRFTPRCDESPARPRPWWVGRFSDCVRAAKKPRRSRGFSCDEKSTRRDWNGGRKPGCGLSEPPSILEGPMPHASPSASLQDLRQIWTYQIAPFMHAVCIAPWACLRTAKLSVASIRPMRRRSPRLGCGHSFSGTTKVEARRTAMLRPERPPWQPLPRVGDASK
jgi:hypothetical protein